MQIQTVRIISNNICFGPEPLPDDEVEQHLTISASGRIWFTGYKYGNGFGQFEISRKQQFNIGKSAVKEILELFSQYIESDQLTYYATDIGTRRIKITFHSRDPLDFSYDVAFEIIKSLGGDLESTAKKVAASFDYIFHFIQLKNKNQKRLKSIYELGIDRRTREITMKEICRYDHKNDKWGWNSIMTEDKQRIGEEENPEAMEIFRRELAALSAHGEYKDDNSN